MASCACGDVLVWTSPFIIQLIKEGLILCGDATPCQARWQESRVGTGFQAQSFPSSGYSCAFDNLYNYKWLEEPIL